MTIFVILLSCCNIFLWIFFFATFKKKFSPDTILAQIKAEVNKLIIEINQGTYRDITLLESRMKGLKALIEEADRRTLLADKEEGKRLREQAVLESLQQSKVVNRSVSSVTARAAAAYATESVSLKTGALKTDQGDLFTAVEQTPAVVEENTSESVFPQFPERPAPDLSVSFPHISVAQDPIVPKKDTRSQVLDLAASGFAADMIAEKLSISVTEVELYTNMYGI